MKTRKVNIKRYLNHHLMTNKKIDFVIQLLIICSLVSYSMETLPDLTERTVRILQYIEIFIISFFTIEYILRIITSPKPLKFVTSFWGIVDALAIIPYYLATGLDIRYVRILRLLRLVRILKIFRNNNTLKRLKRSCVLAKEELLLFLGIALIILYVSSVGIYYCEHEAQPEAFKSIPHSMWWAIATLTTVGYGDVYPITIAGKIFTGIVVLMGLGFIAMPASILTSALSQARREEKNNESY